MQYTYPKKELRHNRDISSYRQCVKNYNNYRKLLIRGARSDLGLDQPEEEYLRTLVHWTIEDIDDLLIMALLR